MTALHTFLAASLLVASGAVQAQAIGYDGARHLLNRTGFGATDAEIRDHASLTRAQAVDRILAGTRREAVLKPPAFVDTAPLPYYKLRQMKIEDIQADTRRNVQLGLELREWWVHEMLNTPSPLTEKMTLFWHNHFATSQQKVRQAQLMYRQNALLRRESTGNFGTLLHAIARDPAMLVYLDNANSRRQAPNENFAREVMELFTVGEGHYGERDIKEAARAFTGWSLDRETLEFTFRRVWHDGGEKTVLGRTGRFDGDGVLDILLERPETAEFIATKLWREMVSPTAPATEVKRLAGVFRDARYEVKPLLRAMLLSESFWSESSRGALIKSPVELVVGTLRTFEIRPFTLRPAVLASAQLGQNPMSPPNVKGWPGGEAWIDSATLLARKQLLERVFRGSDAMTEVAPMTQMVPASDDMKAEAAKGPQARYLRMMERGMQTYAFDMDKWSRTLAPKAPVESLVLATAAVNPAPTGTEGIELVRHLVSDPAYQLK